ncbi:MAG TPA: hypothetical protein VGX92_05405 [Pyrinomonadaceae bacterium]|jgi:Na+-driven multidrug efflux pump|nr:hypothetical protein [Pyrinomonadaceae bacterium]
MRKSVNIIVRITLVFMIIGATLNVVGEILLARGGAFPPTSSLWAWGLEGAGVGLVVGAIIGVLVALAVGAFKKYTSTHHQG